MAGQQYRVIRGIKDLPPRDVKVVRINADPTTIDLISSNKALAFDFLIKNDDATTANVQVEENLTYTVGSGSSVGETDVQVSRIIVSGITNGYVILHIVELDVLRRIDALEVR